MPGRRVGQKGSGGQEQVDHDSLGCYQTTSVNEWLSGPLSQWVQQIMWPEGMILAFTETNPILSVSLPVPGFPAPWRRVISHAEGGRLLTGRLVSELIAPSFSFRGLGPCVIGPDVATAPYSLSLKHTIAAFCALKAGGFSSVSQLVPLKL